MSAVKKATISSPMLILLGLAATLTYLYAWSLQDLREHTIEFLVAFFVAFLIYAIAVVFALSGRIPASPPGLVFIFGLAALWMGMLVFTPPTLSDDMYRYIWDGRVQTQGISPYRYAPAAPELAPLRDSQIWPHINRKTALTVYPPAAEIAFGLLWRIWPDKVRWFQAVTAGMALLAGTLLVGLLHDLRRPLEQVLIFLWSPLLLFETAHAAHIDGLVMPLLVGAWWGRVRERDGLVGFLIGIATAMKFYPALLLPALWRPNHPQGRWRMPLAFAGGLLASYIPYLLQNGAGVLGFLPRYLREQFNVSPLVKWILENIPHQRYSEAQRGLLLLTLGLLALVSLVMVLRPAASGEAALRRCLWPIAILTLFSQNLFSWYMLWLLPLLAIFLQPGQIRWRGQPIHIGLRLDAWTGWWLFCGLAALSYTFFLDWKTVPAAIQLQFWPLYIFLTIDLLRQIYLLGIQKSTYLQHITHNHLPRGTGQ
jgi:hypothetical protein